MASSRPHRSEALGTGLASAELCVASGPGPTCVRLPLPRLMLAVGRGQCVCLSSHSSLRSTRHIVGAALEVGKFKVELHVPKTPVMTERSRKAYRGLTFGLKALKCCFPHGTHRIWHIVDA